MSASFSRKASIGSGLVRAAALGTAAALAYLYQPQRYDFFPEPVPTDDPWIEPNPGSLFSPDARVAIVTAHPDDSEFYIGGTLARLADSGAQTFLIVGTDGDKGYYPFQDAETNRHIRKQEQRDAARNWGAREVIFLGYPDGRLPVSPDLVDRITGELRRIQPEYILSFDPRYVPRVGHRDHRNAGEGAWQAVRAARVGTWLLQFATRAPNWALDVSPEWSRKIDLLSIHRSQFHGKRLKMVQEMVSQKGAAHGRLLGVKYAEAFRCIRV